MAVAMPIAKSGPRGTRQSCKSPVQLVEETKEDPVEDHSAFQALRVYPMLSIGPHAVAYPGPGPRPTRGKTGGKSPKW